jgi:drug/metabolite transporter (DMT)-like permease
LTSAADCDASVVPALLALASAMLFALGIHFARLGLRHSDSQTGTFVTIFGATAVYWLGAPFFVEAWYWLTPAALLFAAIGVFRPALSGNLAMAGTKHLGPTIAMTLASTAPLFGLAFGVLLLGEPLGVSTLVGTLAIMAGVVLLSRRGDGPREWPAWALLLPVGAAFIRVLAQLLAKVGMETLPSPFFVGLVGYSVSLAVAFAGAALRRGGLAGRVRTPGLPWFLAGGLVNGISILSLNTALACGELVLVSPIVSSSPLFTLVFGFALFRDRTIDARVAWGVLLVVSGVALVAARLG